MKYSIRRNNDKGVNLSAAILRALMLMSIFMPVCLWGNETKEDHQTLNLKAGEVFSKLDCKALEILPKSVRLDMLDYWAVDSVYKAMNVMEGLSWIEQLTDNYMKVRITGVSELEIKILPVKKGEIVMTLYTVGSSEQAKDTQADFYDSSLNRLETSKYLKQPDLKDFFEIPKGSMTSMKEIREMVPFPTIAYTAFDNSDRLEATLTIESYIDPDDWNILKLFIKPNIISTWHKDKFEF